MAEQIINIELLKKRSIEYAPTALRIAMSIVFLYFGISQLRQPEAFIGWLPPEVASLPISPRTFVILNGGFETFFGGLLLMGLFTRISAFLLGAHLLGITFTIGWTQIGVRDLSLSLSALVVTMLGPGPYSLDRLFFPLRSENFRAANNAEHEDSKDHSQEYSTHK